MAGWRTYLPDSPDTLSLFEIWLYVVAGIGGLLAILLPFAAREIARHRTGLVLTSALGERDAKYAELQKKTDALESANAPRRITDEQLSKLKTIMQTNPIPPQTIRVMAIASSNDAMRYADQWADWLRHLHWDVGGVDQFLDARKGVSILVAAGAPDDVRDAGRALALALERAGVPDVTFRPNTKPTMDQLQLSVGHKPAR
jgi:hypothetical protein